MMSGGIFMMGFGLIALLLVVTLPIVLIAVLIWASTRNERPLSQAPAIPYMPTVGGRACSHCGATLQTGWSHCPQCGTPIEKG